MQGKVQRGAKECRIKKNQCEDLKGHHETTKEAVQQLLKWVARTKNVLLARKANLAGINLGTVEAG